MALAGQSREVVTANTDPALSASTVRSAALVPRMIRNVVPWDISVAVEPGSSVCLPVPVKAGKRYAVAVPGRAMNVECVSGKLKNNDADADAEGNDENERMGGRIDGVCMSVSYTHLTLPTKRIV